MPYKYMRGVGQVLENERGWRGMPGCWYGPKLSMWTLSREAKSVTSVHSAGEGAKKSPGDRREELYTSSADESFKSFHALRIPNRTKGRASAQCSSAWHMRAAFS